MTEAQRFAIDNVDKLVIVDKSHSDAEYPLEALEYNGKIHAYVVGYWHGNSHKCVLIKICDKEINKNCWRPISKYAVIISNKYPNCLVWSVPFDALILATPNKPVTLYPHVCKYCKAEARKCGQLLFCSNVRCKSRKKIKLVYRNTTKPNGNVVLCPTCHNIVVQLYYFNKENFTCYCISGHKFLYKAERNDVVKTCLSGSTRDLKYDGVMWNSIPPV